MLLSLFSLYRKKTMEKALRRQQKTKRSTKKKYNWLRNRDDRLALSDGIGRFIFIGFYESLKKSFPEIILFDGI